MDRLRAFELVVRRSHLHTEAEEGLSETQLHPFDRRNMHDALPLKTRQLFDDGHYAEATFHAFKFLDKLVQKHSHLQKTGYKLMMEAFHESSGPLKLTPLIEQSEIDEQKGFQFLFAGSVWAIRNPRGHETLSDDPDMCLDHLAFASMLIRRLEQAGFKP